VALDRNGLEIIGEDDCWLLLGSQHVDDDDGAPSLVFLSAPGSKLAGALLGTAVCFEIDAADPLFHTGWSVVAHGRAAEVDTLDELVRVEELPLRPWGPSEKRNYVRITVDEVTGRRILPPGSG
jgi:nitroimidazol reductase NimA-like FMN-containing flavoprotein (pyridoxamine 5'-phosphate oxidase superfamily)